MQKVIFLSLFLGLSITSYGQESVEGDLFDYLESIIFGMPGSGGNDYADPESEVADKWGEVIDHILDEDYASADQLAGDFDYRLIAFTATGLEEEKVYYILQREEESENYWGTYVFNPTACRTQLVVQSPHAIFDSNTGRQGAYIFSKVDAAAFFISGTHRCNSSTATSCSGSTSVCGSNQAYRISDVAHNTGSMFQKTTEVFHERSSAYVFAQLHGFAKQATDPDAILSNGTRIEPNVDYIDQLVAALGEIDNTLTFKVGHQDFDWNRLLALSNTQGRFINGSTDACSTNATNSAGKFMHIEQSYDKLRANSGGWDKMVEGFIETFACGDEVTAVDPVLNGKYRVYPNPFREYLTINYPETGGLWFELYGVAGSLKLRKQLNSVRKIDVSELEKGIYIYQLRNANEIIDRKKLYKH